MKLILEIGNFLNHGTNKGNASGFDLDTLVKLDDIKSICKKLSLLYFILRNIDETKPKLLCFIYEFRNINKALKLDIGEVERRVKEILSNLNNAE